MSESEDRVQEALAAYLEQLEVGGPEPDVSHLSPAEREALQSLIGLLDQTEGVAFGRGLDQRPLESAATTEAGGRLVAAVREVLPPGTRTVDDPAAANVDIAGTAVAEGWIVGTFGGRIRVWLLERRGALEESESWLSDLARIFRLFPDTAAIALVEPDLSCLLVQPEDCAPAIAVPVGSLVARRYRRPVLPVEESLSVFLRDLIPSWEPVQGIGEQAPPMIEVPPIADERARRAVEDQVAMGGRARKTNPKRTALTGLGEKEAGALARLVVQVSEGSVGADDLEGELRRLATNR